MNNHKSGILERDATIKDWRDRWDEYYIGYLDQRALSINWNNGPSDMRYEIQGKHLTDDCVYMIQSQRLEHIKKCKEDGEKRNRELMERQRQADSEG